MNIKQLEINSHILVIGLTPGLTADYFNLVNLLSGLVA